MTRTILLANGKGTVLVDDADYDAVSQHGWSADGFGYARARINGKIVKMHRWLMGCEPGQAYDHINGDKSDNRRQNIRRCTLSQNKANTPRIRSNKSGYKGVCWHKVVKKFQAYITVNRQRIALGYFDTAEEAAREYDKAAIENYQEFARLNFPTEEIKHD